MVKRMRSFFAVVMLVIAATVNAQVTTSSMSGKVVDQSNEAIIGATIQAIHEPSGTHYGALPMWTAVIPSRACVPAALTK